MDEVQNVDRQWEPKSKGAVRARWEVNTVKEEKKMGKSEETHYRLGLRKDGRVANREGVCLGICECANFRVEAVRQEHRDALVAGPCSWRDVKGQFSKG